MIGTPLWSAPLREPSPSVRPFPGIARRCIRPLAFIRPDPQDSQTMGEKVDRTGQVSILERLRILFWRGLKFFHI